MNRKKEDKAAKKNADVLITHVPVSRGFCALVPTVDLTLATRYVAQSLFNFPRHWLFENEAWCAIGHNLFPFAESPDSEESKQSEESNQSAFQSASWIERVAFAHEALALLGIDPYSALRKICPKQFPVARVDLEKAFAFAGLANTPLIFRRIAAIEWFRPPAKGAQPTGDRIETIERTRKQMAVEAAGPTAPTTSPFYLAIGSEPEPDTSKITDTAVYERLTGESRYPAGTETGTFRQAMTRATKAEENRLTSLREFDEANVFLHAIRCSNHKGRITEIFESYESYRPPSAQVDLEWHPPTPEEERQLGESLRAIAQSTESTSDDTQRDLSIKQEEECTPLQLAVKELSELASEQTLRAPLFPPAPDTRAGAKAAKRRAEKKEAREREEEKRKVRKRKARKRRT